jgi:hypothetical protein
MSMDTAFVQAFLNLVILWLPLKIVESLLGQLTWKDTTYYYGKIKNIIEITFVGSKPLVLVFFECKWHDPNYYRTEFGMTRVQPENCFKGTTRISLTIKQTRFISRHINAKSCLHGGLCTM